MKSIITEIEFKKKKKKEEGDGLWHRRKRKRKDFYAPDHRGSGLCNFFYSF